jgi:septal ring factor EnvC (AmiA/AmiB activator)
MQKLLLIIGLSITSYSFGLTANEVHENLGSLNNKISQINTELNKQQNQQKTIDNAIKYSDSAISQSNSLLNKLKHQKALELNHLNETKTLMSQLNQALTEVKNQTRKLIDKLYQQIEIIKTNNQSSILSDNTANNRKKAYLTAIINHQQQQLIELESKVNNLNTLDKQIEAQLNQLNDKLEHIETQQSKLKTVKQQQLSQAESIQHTIQNRRDQLHSLKQQQAKLNQLMERITAKETQASPDKENLTPSTHDNQKTNPPFAANIAKPIDAKVALGYGKVRDNVNNKGILYEYTENSPIKAISNGKVVYSGSLPGFGSVVIIDHGNSYVSIYSGLITHIKLNSTVKTGEIIATTGERNNQPMGGFYFEIRHLGKPIDPTPFVR